MNHIPKVRQYVPSVEKTSKGLEVMIPSLLGDYSAFHHINDPDDEITLRFISKDKRNELALLYIKKGNSWETDVKFIDIDSKLRTFRDGTLEYKTFQAIASYLSNEKR